MCSDMSKEDYYADRYDYEALAEAYDENQDEECRDEYLDPAFSSLEEANKMFYN